MPQGEGGGRPAKPRTLKILHGDRSDRINDDEPIPSAGEIVPPFELSGEGQANWDRLAPDRIRVGVLTAWDVDAFAVFCEALALARKGLAEAPGPVIAGAPSPMSRLKDALAVCTTLGGRFGWTPADRAKLITGEARRDPAEDLLSG